MGVANKYMVGVRCMTYNQSAYITDAMNGFCIQQTSFPFLAIVMDDASTDGEQAVIEDYIKGNFLLSDISCQKWETEEARWLFAQHRENSNCYFLVIFLKRNMYKQKQAKLELIKEWEDGCKYLALCEGDDYWTDPLKLQKQVDFLETHEEYSMCFHKVSVVYEGEIKQEQLFERLQEGDYSAYDIYADWMVPTCTVVYRNSPVPFESNSRIVFGDIFLWLQLAERGKIYCLDFVGGTYRRHEKGVSFNYFGETNARLFRQYEFMEKRFPELQLVSKMKKDKCLEETAFSPYFPRIWRYRILYLFRHPKRFFIRLLPFLLWKR